MKTSKPACVNGPLCVSVCLCVCVRVGGGGEGWGDSHWLPLIPLT